MNNNLTDEEMEIINKKNIIEAFKILTKISDKLSS